MSKLISFSSQYVKAYIRKNPVDDMTCDARLAWKGGPGDKKTPTMAMEVFYDLLQIKESLFTQCEYFNFAIHTWSEVSPDWFISLNEEEQKGIKVRLYRQFYTGAIDQIFCQAMLVESGFFNRVKYISRAEMTGVDLLAYTKLDNEIKIGLSKDTAKQYETVKNNRRGGLSSADFNVYKPTKERLPLEGNFVWYEIGDFSEIMRIAIEESKSNLQQKPFYI